MFLKINQQNYDGHFSLDVGSCRVYIHFRTASYLQFAKCRNNRNNIFMYFDKVIPAAC